MTDTEGRLDAQNVIRETVATYDRIALRYQGQWGSSQVMVADLQQFISKLPAKARVLDLGCGPGRDLAFLSAAGLEAIGLDRSRAMLGLIGIRLQTVCADALALPFLDETFAGVWACASLLHVPKSLMPRALREIHRVLAPGGRLYVSARVGDSEAWVQEPEGRRFFADYKPLELDLLLNRAGFQVEEASERPDASGRPITWITRFAVACPELKGALQAFDEGRSRRQLPIS